MIKSILEDKFMKGLTAGLLAGALSIGWNFFSMYILHFSTLVYGNFAAGFIFHRKPEKIWEIIFSVSIAFLFLGFLGIVVAFLIPHIKSNFLPIKCWVISSALWFAIYAVTIMFRIPSLVEISSLTALSNLIGAAIWGISMGFFFNLLEKWKNSIS